MGQSQSSPNSPRHMRGLQPHKTRTLAQRNFNTAQKDHDIAKKCCSCIRNTYYKGRRLSCNSCNEDGNEARVSTTLKSKRSSTLKLEKYASQDPRKSEDFDMGQMDEDMDVLTKRVAFPENTPYVASGSAPNKNIRNCPARNDNSLLSSYHTASTSRKKESRPGSIIMGYQIDRGNINQLGLISMKEP